MRRRRVLSIASGLLAVGLVVSFLAYQERILYVAGQAVFQGELLWGRVPIDEAIASGRYSDDEVRQLQRIGEIKAYGVQIGLAGSQNYDSINPTWDHTIWNLSASDPVKFENVRWWFPIVGSMPYIGYFDRVPADEKKAELEAEGYDVYLRTAGAYSTLGWFRDPVMPAMLKWDEYRLANTILHELTHATVWIRGSVQFNESFANFVGDEAARSYMVDRYGPDSAEVTAMEDRIRDGEDWRTFMRGIYHDLDAVYTDDALSRDDKLAQKAAILGSLGQRIDGVGFRDPERYRKYVTESDWNNARMMQFRTYNRSRDWFDQLYQREQSDLPRFMARVQEIAANADDPYRALADAVGADFDAEE
ncbi:MAG: aminopeptidase [Myxococcota bacterium]